MRTATLIVFLLAFQEMAGYAQAKLPEGAAIAANVAAADSERFAHEFFTGLKAKTLGDSKAAMDHFSRAARMDPSQDAVWYELALLHYMEGDSDEALKMIDQALALNGEEIWYLGLKADLLQKEKRYEALLKVYDQLITLKPDQPEHYFNKAETLLALSRSAEALEIYDRLEEQMGPGIELAMARQKAYLQAGNTEAGLEAIEQLIDAFPKEPRYYLMQGELYEAGHRSGKAAGAYRKALQIEPENGYARLALADHYRNRGKAGDSYVELKRAFQSRSLPMEPKLSILLNHYVKPENSAAEWRQTEELAAILMETYPKDARGYAVAGDVFLQQKKRKEARDAYKMAVRYQKDVLLLWEQLLRLEISLEDYAAVAETSTEALRYFPRQTEFYLFNGVARMQQGAVQKAIHSLQKGLELAENDTQKLQFYSNLGDAYHAAGEHAASDKAFESALKLDESNSLIMNNYAYYLALREQELDKARRMARASVRMEPENVSYLDTYAWVLYKSGNYQEAYRWMKKAIEAFPNSPSFAEHYGDILYRLGEEEKAIEMWNRAKKLGAESAILDKKIRERKLYE